MSKETFIYENLIDHNSDRLNRP